MMDTDDRRRASRFSVNLKVHIRNPGIDTTSDSKDVSRYGIFLALSGEPKVGQTLWMDIELPNGAVIEVTTILTNKRSFPFDGYGCNFVSMLADDLSLWVAYISDLERRANLPARTFVGSPNQPVTDTGGEELALMVWAPMDEGLRAFETKHISPEGMFIRSERMLLPDTEVDVLVIHPQTQAGFPFRAKVVRCEHNAEEGERGMLVRFLDQTFDEREEFRHFLAKGGVPEPSVLPEELSAQDRLLEEAWKAGRALEEAEAAELAQRSPLAPAEEDDDEWPVAEPSEEIDDDDLPPDTFVGEEDE